MNGSSLGLRTPDFAMGFDRSTGVSRLGSDRTARSLSWLITAHATPHVFRDLIEAIQIYQEVRRFGIFVCDANPVDDTSDRIRWKPSKVVLTPQFPARGRGNRPL